MTPQIKAFIVELASLMEQHKVSLYLEDHGDYERWSSIAIEANREEFFATGLTTIEAEDLRELLEAEQGE